MRRNNLCAVDSQLVSVCGIKTTRSADERGKIPVRSLAGFSPKESVKLSIPAASLLCMEAHAPSRGDSPLGWIGEPSHASTSPRSSQTTRPMSLELRHQRASSNGSSWAG